MSIRLMSAVFDSDDLGPTERLIMLALADHADDTGRCYPSIARLCRRTGLTGRSVQINIRKLQDRGYVSIMVGVGQGGSNVYLINATPALYSPPLHEIPPAVDAPPCTKFAPPLQEMHIPPAVDAPKPPITIIEPSVISKNTQNIILGILCEVHGVTVEAAKSFIAYRRKSKAKALTETAAKRLSKHLWEIFNRGGDPSDAMGLAEERGWASAEPDWYFKAKGSNYDNRDSHTNKPRRAGDGAGTIDAFAAVAARYGSGAQ